MRTAIPDDLAGALSDTADALAEARERRDRLVVECWRAGATLCAIANQCDVSHETVRRIIRRRA